MNNGPCTFFGPSNPSAAAISPFHEPWPRGQRRIGGAYGPNTPHSYSGTVPASKTQMMNPEARERWHQIEEEDE